MRFLRFNLKERLRAISGTTAREIVGVDFSGSNLKLALLRSYLNKTEVSALITHAIGGLSDADLPRVIRDSFLKLGAKGNAVIDVIPSSLTITKNIEVPSVDPQEIRDIINLQSGRHTPYSREEIIVDYIDIGTYKQSYTKILLVIVARQAIKRHNDILEKAGLKLERVLFSPEGLGSHAARILGIGSDDMPMNVVHIDDSSSCFTIIFRNKLIFVRSIPIGARNLSEEGPASLQRFVQELRRSLESYQNENIEKSPGTVVLTGALLGVKELEASLKEALHIPVKAVPYFERLPLSEKVLETLMSWKYLSFAGVIAALLPPAQLKVDLVPEEVRLRRLIEERGRELIKTGMFVLAIFVLVFLILISKIFFHSAYLKRLEAKFAPQTKESQELQRKFDTIGAIKSYLARRGYSLEVLTELYNLSTLDLEVTDIRFDQQQARFLIRGTAETMSSVFLFIEKLEKSRYLKDVKTKYTTKRKDGNRDVTDFEISAVPTYKGG